jgi:hypothetical protein
MAPRYLRFKATRLGVWDGFEQVLYQNEREASQPWSYCNKELESYDLSQSQDNILSSVSQWKRRFHVLILETGIQ